MKPIQFPDSFEWLAQLPPALLPLCQRIAEAGGRAWLVGGSIRDLCLGVMPKDMDLEVYGLEAEVLLCVARRLGYAEAVGQHFGVVKLWVDGFDIDLALPRTEKKEGEGHRGFAVQHDIHLSPEKAALRRDFTINAMMWDPLSGQFLDIYGGRDDLRQGVLRHVSPAFAEDPLRVLRAMQFAARFHFTLDEETAKLCRTLLPEAESLPASRIWCEWQKWAHADAPSFGLLALQASGWLACYPELEALVHCPQEPYWHPEGDAWVHTLQVCDQAAAIARREQLSGAVREKLLFAALCHDLGKPLSTFVDAEGKVRSPDHSRAGLAPSVIFLQRIAAPKVLETYVLPLVCDHIAHLCGEATERAIRRLAHRLEPASIELWEMLVEADASGRAPAPASRPARHWLEKAKQLSSHQQKVAPLVTGKMLLAMGLKPSSMMGEVIRAAYEAQMDGSFDDEASARLWLQQNSNQTGA